MLSTSKWVWWAQIFLTCQQYVSKWVWSHDSPVGRLLASKNLPAAIEDTGGNELPESIRDKANMVKTQGGVGTIESKLYGLPELLQRNKEILNEVRVQWVCVCVWRCCDHPGCVCVQTSRMMEEEERDDMELRDRFKEKWKRETSSKLTETLKKEVRVGKEVHNQLNGHAKILSFMESSLECNLCSV